MGLREQIEADNKNVFINLDEFAEVHTFNDKYKVPCIAQGATLNGDLTVDTRGNPSQYQGLYGAALVINVRKVDMPFVPQYEQILKVDGRTGLITAIADDIGMYTITWVANDV